MADTYRATRIQLGGRPTTVSGKVYCNVSWEDVTTDPHTFGAVDGEIDETDAQDNATLQTAIDGLMSAASLDSIDWSI